MPEPVRIGVVGCGSVMQGGYMPLAERLAARGLATVTMACDTDAVQREAVLARFGIPRLTADYQEVVASDEVDLVLVLTSMPEHGPIARAASTGTPAPPGARGTTGPGEGRCST